MSTRHTTLFCWKRLKKYKLNEKLLFLYLLSPNVSDDSGVCDFSAKKAAKDLNTNIEKILSALNELEKNGEVFIRGETLFIKKMKKYCYAIC